MGLALMLLAAALPLASSQKAEVCCVRFRTSRLAIVRETSEAQPKVGGALRVDFSFRSQSVRKPILRIACLCEEQGELVCHGGLWDRLDTYQPMDRSEVTRLFKVAEYKSPPDRREADPVDPKLISSLTGLVSRDAYALATYGESDPARGFFSLKAKGMPRLLLYRLEIWQNGVQVAAYDSPRTGLGRMSIPKDWHAWRKYPSLFRYEDR